jgi:hypothetical protein
MSSKRNSFVLAAFLCLSFLGVSAAHAEHPDCFTLASIQGNYALIGTYGANVAAALGERHFDGNGNFTGTFLVNEPTAGSTTGARTIITGTQVGTYTVNCDGTGVITRTLTASNGVVTQQMDDFIITKATKKEHGFLATALVDIQRTPSAIVAGGIFLTRAYTRLPDRDGSSTP